jgi:predicted membrane protein
MLGLCAPALIYVIFVVIQIIMDIFYGLYNTALFKFIVMIIFTLILNAFCNAGMSIISWIFVFIPFIFMTTIVSILLYLFGLDVATGLKDKIQDTIQDLKIHDKKGGNLIYSTDNHGLHNNHNGNLIYSSNNNHNLLSSRYMDTSYSESPASFDEL